MLTLSHVIAEELRQNPGTRFEFRHPPGDADVACVLISERRQVGRPGRAIVHSFSLSRCVEADMICLLALEVQSALTEYHRLSDPGTAEVTP